MSDLDNMTAARQHDGLSPDAFRAQVSAWLEDHCPASMRTPMPDGELPWGGRHGTFPNPDTRSWLDRMAGQGWTAPRWPAEYGGAGLSEEKATILEDELRRIGARRPIYSFGLWMLAPVLFEFASEEQRRRFLPPIARGEIRWCQGYSEPGAGSDLASLRTRAVLDGDSYVVNGSKVWTTYADKSDWIFCLVRTDPTASKHAGISFLLFDLDTPGVERRPIRLISGASPFCETFFTDVRVPKENLIGPVGGGWTIAKRLLQYERQNVASAGFGADALRPLEQILLDRLGPDLDPVLRDQVAAWRMHADALKLFAAKNQRRTATEGGSPLASVVKIAAARSNQWRSELLISALGLEALGWEGVPFDDEALTESRAWLRAKANSIEGGTTEINLNILAKAVLDLPSGA